MRVNFVAGWILVSSATYALLDAPLKLTNVQSNADQSKINLAGSLLADLSRRGIFDAAIENLFAPLVVSSLVSHDVIY